MTYFLRRETILVTWRRGMGIWREKPFVLMVAQCDQSDSVFPIPPERVVERGVQVEM